MMLWVRNGRSSTHKGLYDRCVTKRQRNGPGNVSVSRSKQRYGVVPFEAIAYLVGCWVFAKPNVPMNPEIHILDG